MTLGKWLLVVFATILATATTVDAAPKLPKLPRLMTDRGVLSLPSAAPAETLSYGEAPQQKIELFLPARAAREADKPSPVVVLIGGNCWAGDKALQIMRPAAGALINKGYAVWSVGLRGIDDEGGGYPGTFTDLAAAIDRIAENAAEYGLDPDRVVFFGHGSGAHLALWAAGRRNLPKDSPLFSEKLLQPRAVVAAGGFGSLQNWQSAIAASCGADILAKLTSDTGTGADNPEEAPATEDHFAEISPDRLLPTRVPSVVLHGIYDGIAFPAVGLDYATAARRAGDTADLQVAPVSGHFEAIAPGTAAFAQALAAIEKFLR